MKKPLGFALVGGIGFAVDAAVLMLLLGTTSLDPFSARLISVAVALSATWMLNRYITFGPSSRALITEGARYGGVGMATSLINYCIYSALLLTFSAMPPLVALVLASSAAMVLSYLGYSRLVFDR
ncbi:MAG: GtrA family protein [Hyphomicrobiales bacterium]|nr:GtrA family protein [Hyphomicrobiales bacterium]